MTITISAEYEKCQDANIQPWVGEYLNSGFIQEVAEKVKTNTENNIIRF